MKRLLVILPLLLAAGGAAAIERHDMSAMTCEAVQAALQAEGKAILMSPSRKVAGMMKYDRYAAGRTSCGASAQNWAQSTHVKTADGKSCLVYKCVLITRNTPRF